MRGLKLLWTLLEPIHEQVAPFTGAWIETHYHNGKLLGKGVAPFTGAWIETLLTRFYWEGQLVAPFTGAWIETLFMSTYVIPLGGRTLHGCVD